MKSIISQANERYEARYELKRQGYYLDRITKRIAQIYGMEKGEVFKGTAATDSKGKESSLLLGSERGRYVAQRIGGAIGNKRPKSRFLCGKGGGHCTQEWV